MRARSSPQANVALWTIGRLSASSLLLLLFSPTLLSTDSRKARNERRHDADDDGDSRGVVYDDTSFDLPPWSALLACRPGGRSRQDESMTHDPAGAFLAWC